jgi:hypothetical protein
MARLAATTLFPTPPFPDPTDTIVAIEADFLPWCVCAILVLGREGIKHE